MKKYGRQVEEEWRESKNGVKNSVKKLLIRTVEIVSQKAAPGCGAATVYFLNVGKGLNLNIVFNENIVVENKIPKQNIAIGKKCGTEKKNQNKAVFGNYFFNFLT